MLDAIGLDELGFTNNTDKCIEAILSVSAFLDVPDCVCVNSDSSSSCHTPNSCSSEPASLSCGGIEVCDLDNEGIPDQGTPSFLFDGVDQTTDEQRAVSERAYFRLAAFRERVLARLNAHL